MLLIPSRSPSFLRTGLWSLIPVCLVTMLVASPAASFPTFTQTCYGPELSHAIAVADFNGDGNLDFTTNPGENINCLAISFDVMVNLYLGHGDGTFAFAAPHYAGSFPAPVRMRVSCQGGAETTCARCRPQSRHHHS